jgi:signal peptidase II
MKFPPLSLVVIASVLIDQAVKWLVETTLAFEELVPVLPFLGLYRTWNFGVAFSFLSSLGPLALIIMTVLIIAFVGWLWSRAGADKRYARLGFALIIGGAIGNLIDRVFLGHVVDYVLFHTPFWSFAVFNLADALITIGALFILIQEFSDWRSGRQKARSG